MFTGPEKGKLWTVKGVSHDLWLKMEKWRKTLRLALRSQKYHDLCVIKLPRVLPVSIVG